MAAAVVKPLIRDSDRYITTKPTCRTPRSSWREKGKSPLVETQCKQTGGLHLPEYFNM